MPFAGFKDFNACVSAQKADGKSEESARKICGAIKARVEKAAIVDADREIRRVQMADRIQKHQGPGPHPGTGTDQDIHSGGRPSPRADFTGEPKPSPRAETDEKIEELTEEEEIWHYPTWQETAKDTYGLPAIEDTQGWLGPMPGQPYQAGRQALSAKTTPSHWILMPQLDKLNKKVERLGRKAEKLGFEDPVRLELLYDGPDITNAKLVTHTWTVEEDTADFEAGEQFTWVGVKLTGDRPVLEGHEIVARLEHLEKDLSKDGATLVHRAPGVEDDLDLSAWRTAKSACVVCNRNIFRKDTDPAATGEVFLAMTKTATEDEVTAYQEALRP